ncbi:hypothetical protein A2926_01075 [Candidatus Giovannonibacteria bacterium RIFCSPLOWO2_01_FULL_44_40]|uniref:LysM domain-containing protein n=1 Tax=Candidatus Giovannonibacteria bacterium RIFCSPHIGHO2_01_FULL_45_23 TaxID=1798325 RepID=A0A1F5VGR2_9BACT|nr:MAG: hypothetical protein A2834_02615 [Candidatus Giovannonibacteria bacterium RIFCSPHIGHO2_01_FULL_45_23]OGF75176.1 MAG: hypothetical protein A3C77_03785 [Candidatus Giovannonibacteria bacterium RIFCSPHIGHO2_02_FULL_45_13]OGF80029.1 MAG: hypothetical protein A2926_01075 [Candidatus Giovannonibacteria bacterium RIFCSPLOWO2_01_FULL_44_40]
MLVLVLALSAGTAHAGFLSFLSKLLINDQDIRTSYNAQNIPLLKAPSTPDPKAATGGAIINLVDNLSLLPVVGPMGSIADVEDYKLDQITIYIVREGDTLSKIADMFGVSVSTIYWANDLKRGDLIKAGDTLVILPITGLQYTVKKGDTIKAIAAKYKSDAQEIIAYNNLPADGVLEEGVTIIIPDAELASLPQSSARLRGSGGPTFAGYFTRPIIGGRKTQGLHGFNGVDLADNCGTPVYASAGGTVIVARSQGWNGGYGRYIAISHPNGTQTLYAHLLGVYASVGQYVSQSSNIGTIGSTGNSTGCHVHFEVRGARNPY